MPLHILGVHSPWQKGDPGSICTFYMQGYNKDITRNHLYISLKYGRFYNCLICTKIVVKVKCDVKNAKRDIDRIGEISWLMAV